MKLTYSTMLMAALSLAACNFDPAVEQVSFCAVDDDCRTGRVCLDGECQAPSSSRVDMGTADATEPVGCSVDRDGDGFKFGPGCDPALLDCDDSSAQVFPGAPTSCNGADNNCDGEIDTAGCECTNGLIGECGFTVGTCETGTRICADGKWGECRGVTAGSEELCNGEDDNCDGTVDEGCPCSAGDVQPCGSAEGACELGEQRCVDGTWSACEGAVQPSVELCNGVDDDCDGVTDDAPQDVGAPCTAAADGVCAAGQQTCSGGQLTCAAGQGGAETCNGLDDDCDGLTDEELAQACSSACGAGTQVCESGGWAACVPDAPPAEICNGVDDDCDGLTDETFPEDGATCDTGQLGVCAAGVSTCATGNLDCVPNNPGSQETCDGVDNDCDGLVDEDSNGLALAEVCGGACPGRAVRYCSGGAWTACDVTDVELCNNLDDNCDNRVDNIGSCLKRCSGGGEARGTIDCTTGDCELPAEICDDGVDNDCDGVVDQNCDGSLSDVVHVPGGTFWMGAPAGSFGQTADEQPFHLVELDAYYIDRYEVSRAQYADCVFAGRCPTLNFGCPLQLTQRDSPITCVTWSQADDYCDWRGKRLPTEAEWEKAARGPYPRAVLWPWGDVLDINRARMECGGSLNQCTVAVDSYAGGRSYYGLHHMAGNAAEWVFDFYDANFYGPGLAVQPVQNNDAGFGHVLRGGGWSQTIDFGRVANRAYADFVGDTERGFRCAK